MPHNFIRISPYTPSPTPSPDAPKPKLRKQDDVSLVCKNHGGDFERLLFDAETEPQFAFVLFKNGDVDGTLGGFGGGIVVGRYFDSDEMKPIEQ